MPIDITTILYLFIILSAVTYYAGFGSSQGPLSYKSKAAFIVSTFGLIPACLIMLWFQHTAIDKLADTGIVPHPAIVKADLPFGWDKDAYFEFTMDASKHPAPYDFYRDEKNRPGWIIVSENPQMMILRRNKVELVIMSSEDQFRSSRSIIYSFHKRDMDERVR